MKLFDYETYEDYGKEWFFQVLTSPKFALLDIAVQWDEFPAPELFPMLIMSIGSTQLFGFTFRWKWFEISVDLIDTKPRNFEWYRRNNDR
jgi:hypothetical protein